MREPFRIGGVDVSPGERRNVDLFVARLYTHTQMVMPVEVLHSEVEGPTFFLSATLHGDEINGVEIIRRVLNRVDVEEIAGTLLAVPVVNVFGFVYQSRYLPDRRDLNRSFPGSVRGSQASRLARLFWSEVVSKCSHGVDLHTAAPPRTNLPQIRARLEDDETRRCAVAFGAPVMLGNAGPQGSLRRTAADKGIHLLVYEAGEPQRFNEDAIELGVAGVLRMLNAVGMAKALVAPAPESIEARSSRWVRARQSGVLRLEVSKRDRVARRQVIGHIGDPLGGGSRRVRAPFEGLVIGHVIDPLVHQGDAVVHLAELERRPE